jgi:hypothetical protein
MEPGIYLYKGTFFSLEDTPEGAYFKSLNGDYWFSSVAVPYVFKGKTSLEMKLDDFFAHPKLAQKVKVVVRIKEDT